MPSRNRNREAAKARDRAKQESEQAKPKPRAGKKKSSASASKSSKNQGRSSNKKPLANSPGGSRRRTGPMFDPSAADDAEVRYVMAGDATKAYLCPGCNREIPAGVGHVVAVPPDAPDLRRHWHRGCWNSRHTRF